MSISIKIHLNPNLCLRDPQDTKLGRKILLHSILLIEKLGFESFTFKKLAVKIESTEASIYRYFENKHLLLIYLVSWYWEWVAFQIDINTMNVRDSKERIRKTIHSLLESSRENPLIEYISESALHKIVIAEGSKAYHTIDVDHENQKGYFGSYKALILKISEIIILHRKDFPYPHTLATNLVEMATSHIYYAQHLPRLTDIHVEEGKWDEVIEMLNFFAFKLLDS